MDSLTLRIHNASHNTTADYQITAKVVAIGASGDVDLRVAGLRSDALYFANLHKNKMVLREQISDAPMRTIELGIGEKWELDSVAWEVLVPQTSNDSEHSEHAFFIECLRWLEKPMRKDVDLRTALDSILYSVIAHSQAGGGMLALKTDVSGFKLITTHGMTPEMADELWSKLPNDLVESIMRKEARVILPHHLEKTVSDQTTVYVKGFKSYVGFPVMSDGQVLGLYFLYFDNLLASLSDERQELLESLSSLIGIVIQRALMRRQIDQQHYSGTSKQTLPDGRLMVGQSHMLKDVYELIGRLAPVDVSVLITGETGTGKELVAREIFRLSPRNQNPFIIVNASALPESLIESELFGHKRGSFTGALTDRVGLVEQAHGGTLFIDEVGEIPPTMQAKLLRVLQERMVHRIGENIPRPADFRLVTATHRNLQELVSQQLFREDLYYRIAGAEIHLPPLRERSSDVILLANYFKSKFVLKHGLKDKEWAADAIEMLETYSWPGNIRELENTVCRAFVMADGNYIASQHLKLHDESNSQRTLQTAAGADQGMTFTEAKEAWMKTYLSRALKLHNGKRAETAKYLGIGQRTLFRYIEQYDIRDA